jgi:hypothetical protein
MPVADADCAHCRYADANKVRSCTRAAAIQGRYDFPALIKSRASAGTGGLCDHQSLWQQHRPSLTRRR